MPHGIRRHRRSRTSLRPARSYSRWADGLGTDDPGELDRQRTDEEGRGCQQRHPAIAVTGAKVKNGSPPEQSSLPTSFPGIAERRGLPGCPRRDRSDRRNRATGAQGATGLLRSTIVRRTDVALPLGAGPGRPRRPTAARDRTRGRSRRRAAPSAHPACPPTDDGGPSPRRRSGNEVVHRRPYLPTARHDAFSWKSDRLARCRADDDPAACACASSRSAPCHRARRQAPAWTRRWRSAQAAMLAS